LQRFTTSSFHKRVSDFGYELHTTLVPVQFEKELLLPLMANDDSGVGISLATS